MELDILKVKQILNEGLKTGADFAELFVQDAKQSSYVIFNKRIDSIRKNKVQGVGIRLRKNGVEVYGSVSSYDPKEILKLTKKLAQNFSGDQNCFVRQITKEEFHLPESVISHDSWSTEKKINILQDMEKKIYAYSDKIVNVKTALLEVYSQITIYNSFGKEYTKEDCNTRLSALAIAYDGTNYENSFEGPGYFGGLELFDKVNIDELCQTVAKDAVDLLTAEPCPNGERQVILGNKFGGVLFHEACGHPLEACSITRNLSVFTNKMGEKIASDVVNAIDDGTIDYGFGHILIDDEGNKPTRNQLIKDGVLVSYMVDNANSELLKKQHPEYTEEQVRPTGSCRRESYKYCPTTRMTNTFIDNGKSTVEEIIKATKNGIYCVSFKGGQVDPSTDKFTFSVSKAYLVEDGKITKMVKGAGLVGYGYEILKNIDMVANDLDIAPGMCGASSGQIPVTVGQPTLRVSKIMIAGEGK